MLQTLIPSAAPNACATSNRGVLSAAANGLDGFIVQHGGDLDRVFGRSGIDPEQLLHPTLSLPLTNYCKVLEEAARQFHRLSVSGCAKGRGVGPPLMPLALEHGAPRRKADLGPALGRVIGPRDTR